MVSVLENGVPLTVKLSVMRLVTLLGNVPPVKVNVPLTVMDVPLVASVLPTLLMKPPLNVGLPVTVMVPLFVIEPVSVGLVPSIGNEQVLPIDTA